MAESSRTRRDTETAFRVRIIRFSLALAEASRRRERLPRQIADVFTERVRTLAPVVFITEWQAKTSKEWGTAAFESLRSFFEHPCLSWRAQQNRLRMSSPD